MQRCSGTSSALSLARPPARTSIPSSPPTQDGVLFKGNLRGDPDASYAKLTERLRVRAACRSSCSACRGSCVPASFVRPPLVPLGSDALVSVLLLPWGLPASLQAELGDEYKLYLLFSQERGPDAGEERPVVAVFPLPSVTPQVAPGSEAALAAAFGALTVATTLNINGAELFNAALLAVQWDPALVQEAVPGAAAFLAVLGAPVGWLWLWLCWPGWLAACSQLLPCSLNRLEPHPLPCPLLLVATHELGHKLAAGKRGLELAPPLLIPAGLGLLGSFGGGWWAGDPGLLVLQVVSVRSRRRHTDRLALPLSHPCPHAAITRIKSFVPDRTALTAVASAGPLAGSAVALAFMLAGAALTAGGGGAGGIEVDVASFRWAAGCLLLVCTHALRARLGR